MAKADWLSDLSFFPLFISLINDLDINCFTYREFGKDLLKRHKLSPDSVLQVALQLAYYR